MDKRQNNRIISIRVWNLFWLIVLVFASLSMVWAQGRKTKQRKAVDQTQSSLDSLSLGELLNIDLLNMEITVTSDRPDRVSDAPGTVTAYTRNFMDDFGYYTLGELSDLTPGYSSQWELADRMLETRGGFSTTNEKHLIRIDGIPINNVRSGTAYIQESAPLLFADKVEFLRGPASALYGIGAFNGVLNITPFENKQEGVSANSRFSFGSDISKNLEGGINNREHDPVLHKQVMANISIKKPTYYFNANIGYFDRVADMLKWVEGRGDSAGYNMNDYRSIFSRINQKMYTNMGDVSLGFYYINQHSGYGLGWASWANKPTTTKANYHEWRSVIPFLKQNITFQKNLSLSSYLKYHHGVEQGSQANKLGWWLPDTTQLGIFGYKVSTHNWEVYSRLLHDINRYFNYIIGFNYDIRWNSKPDSWTIQAADTSLKSFFAKKSHTTSFFSQVQLTAPVLSDLTLTGGLRLDIGSLIGKSYVQPSPRAALVMRFTENLIMKAMYGTALKAPGIQELGHNDEKQYLIDKWNNENPDSIPRSLDDLDQEILQTVEGNFTFVNNVLFFSITSFYNIIKQQLTRTDIWPSNEIPSDFWVNDSANADALGGELEVRVALPTNTLLLTSGSYTETKDRDNQPLEFMPKLKINVGISQQFNFGLTASAVAKWIPIYTTEVQKIINGEEKNVGKDTTNSHVYIDLNISQKLNDNLALDLKLSNLLDRQLPYTQRIPSRCILFSLRSKF